MTGESFGARVFALVRAVPPGRVTTYGAIARALGFPGGAREVGRALASLPSGSDVPTHRVVDARGVPRCPGHLGTPASQRARLEAEGVTFERGRVVLDRFGWDPASGRATGR